ncbi:MAG: hypothetical protein ABIK07_23190 [Planctomycetota bacterium]
MITETSSLLAIFGLAVTLSAYLSAIRLVAIQKIQDLPGKDQKTDQKTEDKKWDLRKKLGWLTLADIPMVFSAFFLGIDLLWDVLNLNQIWSTFSNEDPRPWFQFNGLRLFLIAGTVMVILHMVAWGITATSLLKGKKIIESEPATEVPASEQTIVQTQIKPETGSDVESPPEKS